MAALTTFDEKLPMFDNKHKISVLLYDGLCMFEFACVAEIFGLPRPEIGLDWYEFETVSIDGQSVKTQYNGEMAPDKSIMDLDAQRTLIIPGWSSHDLSISSVLKSKLIDLYNEGTRVLSICSGVFVLAEAGLLDGMEATTHWKYIDDLSKRFPKINVKTDVLYIDNDRIMTSAGSSAGLDLCLHMIRKDLGSEKANTVARRLVIPPLREGNQAQYVQLPVPSNNKTSISPVLDVMRSEITKKHRIIDLATSLNLSERTFLRRFKAATGTTPGEWLIGIRVQHAKELLERSSLPIETIAERSGFGTAITLRHHFRKRLNVTPTTYRKSFNTIECKA